MDACVAAAIARFGADLKPKLDGGAIDGAPEDQLRAPTETLIRDLALCCGLPTSAVHLVGETTLVELKSRPDYAVVVSGALVGYIEIKAPEKGADPRRFRDEHDKAQWARLKAQPTTVTINRQGDGSPSPHLN